MKQLEIQFHGSSASGPFTIRKPFSVMTAYYVPRDSIKSARGMKGIGRYGIYCLFGDNRIYIGQTRNGIDRIMEHTRGKQFWNEAVLFLADPIHFNLNIISGLERHAIEQAMENSPYEVENKVVPQYETISDFEKEQILTIYEEIAFIMEFVGIRTKKSKMNSKKEIESTQDEEQEISSAEEETIENVNIDSNYPVFHTKRRGIKGLLSIIDGSYVVLKGSVIDIDTPIDNKNHNGIKRRIDTLNDGTIVKKEDGTYVLTKNVVFTSPSGAAVFVLGSNQNGKVEWVDAQNKPLGEYLASLDNKEGE